MKNKRTVSEDVQARVYNALLVGKENALNRDELVSKIGESDRDIRTAIEILRHDKVILTLPTGKGYYIPRDDAQGYSSAASDVYKRQTMHRDGKKQRNGL